MISRGTWALAAVTAGLAVFGFFLLLGPGLANSTPVGSSLRTDPLGSSVLFGALEQEGLQVTRGFDPEDLATMPVAETTAFVVAPSEWENGMGARLCAFARAGGRVILAAPPVPALPVENGDGADAITDAETQGPEKELGIGFTVARKPGADSEAEPTAAAPPGALPVALEHASTTLRMTGAWHPLYADAKGVVMAWRPYGRGTVVVSTEMGFAENDTLAQAPDVALLGWMVGGRRRVWVDESLHGMAPARGVVWLMRRYHLVAGAMILLLGLGLLGWNLAGGLERRPVEGGGDDAALIPETEFEGYVRLLARANPKGTA